MAALFSGFTSDNEYGERGKFYLQALGWNHGICIHSKDERGGSRCGRAKCIDIAYGNRSPVRQLNNENILHRGHRIAALALSDDI
jgi:hypothetical protein